MGDAAGCVHLSGLEAFAEGRFRGCGRGRGGLCCAVVMEGWDGFGMGGKMGCVPAWITVDGWRDWSMGDISWMGWMSLFACG